MLFLSASPIVRQAARSLLPLVVLTGSFIGITLGVYLAMRAPAIERLANAQTAYEAARQLQITKQVQRKTEEALKTVWQDLPARQEFPNFILELSESARQGHVAIPGMNYAIERVENGLALKASISFHVAGNYAAIRRFIHRLETAGHFVFIESLDVKRSTDRAHGASAPVTFDVRVATFLRLDPSSAGGV